MTFGVRLKRARERAGLTQAGLASNAGISLRAFQLLEQGKRQARGDVLVALANALDMTPDGLLLGDEAATPLEIAIQTVGSQAALAEHLGIKPPSIAEWRVRNQVPAERCIAIERACGGAVTRHDLRPDVFGPIGESEVTPQEAALLDAYRQLPQPDRVVISRIAESLASSRNRV